MGNLCGNCQHFKSYSGESIYRDGWGLCRWITDQNEDAPYEHRYRGELGTESSQKAVAWDCEGYSAGLHVHVDFGCVEWTASSTTSRSSCER